MNKNLISKATSCLLFLLIFCAQAWSQETNTVTLVSFGASSADKEGCIVGPEIPATGALEATWNANNAFTMTQHKNSSFYVVSSSDPSIRLYNKHDLTFVPTNGIAITKIVAYTKTSAYASTLGGAELQNCKVSTNSSKLLVTFTPTDGSQITTITNTSTVVQISKIEVTYTGTASTDPTDEKVAASLSFDKQNVTAYLDHQESFVPPVLTSVPANLSDISYHSSNESVATVDASTGNVTLVGVGTTTITASCSETSSHTAAEASYTLVVEENKPQPTTAEVAIVAQRNGKYYAATTTLSNYKLPAVEVVVREGKVINPSDADITWIWDSDNGSLTSKSESKKLAVSSSETSTNLLNSGTDVKWTIDNVYGLVNTKSTNRCLLYSNTSSVFANYAKSNIGNSGYSGAAQLLPIASFATESVTTNQYGWATYAPSHKISIPSVSGVLISYIDRGHLSGSSESLTTTALPSGTTIEVGTGILVKTESPQTTVTFTESAEPATIINNALVGVTVATHLNDETGAYIFTRKEIDGVGRIGFFPCSGGTLSANKCYLKMSEGQQSAPKFLALPDTAVTGIRSVSPKPASRRQDSATYNICGQRVSDGYSGVVIRNGRKLLVR